MKNSECVGARVFDLPNVIKEVQFQFMTPQHKHTHEKLVFVYRELILCFFVL